MKITYKLVRTVRKWIQVENQGGYWKNITETGATGLTWEEAKAQKRGTSWTAVRETIAAPVTVEA